MTTLTRDTSQGQVVCLMFGQHTVAASQTDVQLPVVIGEKDATVDGYTMPFAGQIIAVAASTDAAATAGSLTVGATIGGTEDADTTITITTQTERSGAVARGKARFAAGARIGCEITTSGTWDATTSHLAAQVYVLLDVAGI